MAAAQFVHIPGEGEAGTRISAVILGDLVEAKSECRLSMAVVLVLSGIISSQVSEDCGKSSRRMSA
ncbi:MAG: hypothetical protein IPP55_19625 [Anaerolineales bacterium]|nr:hypothetical protein [Anaerolineales bacterium]